jgi:hypothetical protein
MHRSIMPGFNRVPVKNRSRGFESGKRREMEINLARSAARRARLSMRPAAGEDAKELNAKSIVI